MAVLNWLGVSEFINDLCVTCLKLLLNTQLKSLGLSTSDSLRESNLSLP
jgi:hypothetical protein